MKGMAWRRRLTVLDSLAALAALAVLALLALLAPGAAQAQLACTLPPDAGERLVSGQLQLAWRAEPSPIVVGQPFALLLTLCPATARLQRVDATMPEHRHGMNYRPSLQDLGGGRWRAQGLLWHMAGRWELGLDVQDDGVVHTLRQSVALR